MVKSVSKSDQDIPLEAAHSPDASRFNDEIAKNPPRTPLSASMVDAPGKNIAAAGAVLGTVALSNGKAMPDGAGLLMGGIAVFGAGLFLDNALKTAPAAVLEVATTRPETGQGILSEASDQIDARISSAKDWASANLTHVFNHESAEPESDVASSGVGLYLGVREIYKNLTKDRFAHHGGEKKQNGRPFPHIPTVTDPKEYAKEVMNKPPKVSDKTEQGSTNN
jgi:hypothetical protein